MILRFASFALFIAGGLWAAPPLTTVQDILYKADGTPFQGVAFIEWRSFTAVDNSNIATNNVTTKIIKGNLRVQLVPTTNASSSANYSVTYNSDGNVQFKETWAVPPSSKSVKLKDVRVAGLSSAITPPAADAAPATESDITGLTDDLAARPVKGASFASSRVAFINSAGALDAVTGSLSDCVRTDGSTGPCGDSLPGFTDNEAPAGAVDGSNTSFVLAGVPAPTASLLVYRNGLLQMPGMDYSLNGAAITFATPSVPQQGDVLLASYRTGIYPGSSSGPQVICSGAGTSTAAAYSTQLAACTIPSALLRAGDRFEIRFDYSHAGTGTGFAMNVQWNGSSLVSRSAVGSETIITGRSEATLDAAGIQWNSQSWGGSLSLAVGAGKASAATGLPAVIALLGQMSATTTETVAVRNFTVLRYPGQ